METEWAEVWEGDVEGFFGNCWDFCCRRFENFVEEFVDSVMNYSFGVPILLEIGEKISYLYVHGCPGGAGDIGSVHKYVRIRATSWTAHRATISLLIQSVIKI